MQGITVYDRPGRPTWYVIYTDPRTGRRVFRSTGFRLDDPKGKLQAYAYAREKSESGVAVGREHQHERWSTWAEQWLRARYKNKAKTLASYLGAWKQLSFYLHEHAIHTPRLLSYQDVVNFVLWREAQIKKQSKRPVSRNTAQHNVKVLSRLMREAVRRGYAQGNPCIGIGDDVPPDQPPEKPEFSDEDIAKVRAELARRAEIGRPAEWMAIAFEIALAQGCRLSATQISMHRIDFERWTIRFAEKGGQDFTVPVNPTIRPLLERLRDEGREVTCELPRFASRNFGRVLRECGLKAPKGYGHHTFHSTRVTVISRGARAGVSEQKMMAVVHHGNWAVHKRYTKLRPADVADVFGELKIPAPPTSASPTPDAPQSPDASRASG